MRRVKWLAAEWPFSIRNLGTKLKGMAFNNDSLDGFVIDRIRDEFIDGRFIEKFSFQETVVDPFGKEGYIDRWGYYSTEFSLYSQHPCIEIRNSQRNISDFLGRLLEACNFNLTISPVNIDLIKWVDGLQDALDHKIVVDSMQVSGIKLEDGIYGKVLLKGDKDVRQATENLLKGRSFSIEKMQLKTQISGRKLSVHLSSNGTIKIPLDFTSEHISLLRSSLPRT